jgi:hypothetical protein
MTDTFNCPKCGAPLDYQGSDPIIRCPYCNGSVVVPDNLRSKPAFSSQPHNFTLSGVGDMAGLINQARRFKEVKDLAQAGNMAEAERIYSEITGQSPEIAQTAVQALANGQPITLTGFNMGATPPISYTSSAAQVITTSTINSQLVNAKTSNKRARSLGCGIGCFVVGLVAFILLITLPPVAGGLAGIAVGLKPDLVLTAIPNISDWAGSGYGRRELSIGGEGIGPGLFKDVRAISVNPSSGDIYAAEYSSGRVQKLDAQGKFVTQWILDGKVHIPAIAAGRNGNVYIVASGKLLQYDSNGKFLGQIDTGEYHQINDIALEADGSLLAAGGQDILHINTDGKIVDIIKSPITTAGGEPDSELHIAADGRGNIFVVASLNNAVFKFSPQGKFINRFGSDGDQPGQFSNPSAIAVDGKGQVYVSDFKGVQVFGNDGRYINVLKVEYYGYGLAMDGQGKLYVSTNQNKVDKFSITQ